MATLIFDFDGTIANSFPVIMGIFHELTHLPVPDRSEVERLRKLPLHALSGELHIPRWRVPFLLWRGRKMMKTRLKEVTMFDGVAEVIQKLHEQGNELYVMSSNDTQAIEAFLKQHQLDTYFIQIHGNVGLFAKAKNLKKLLAEHHITDKENCYYIGDEVRDVEAALRVGIKQIAVTWGYNDEQVLKVYYPTALIHKAEDLLTVIKSDHANA